MIDINNVSNGVRATQIATKKYIFLVHSKDHSTIKSDHI